ncbi:MAG TPA: hypothetical protein EYO58_08745 [Flavobacteriales bacterium]|nr:hypothetical protein [Flavobacteriales bacterium]
MKCDNFGESLNRSKKQRTFIMNPGNLITRDDWQLCSELFNDPAAFPPAPAASLAAPAASLAAPAASAAVSTYLNIPILHHFKKRKNSSASASAPKRPCWTKYHEEPLYSKMTSAIIAVRFKLTPLKQVSRETKIPPKTLRRNVGFSKIPGYFFFMTKNVLTNP